MTKIGKSIERLSPLTVSIAILIVTLFSPIMVTAYGWGGDSEGRHWVDLVIIALTWIYVPMSINPSPRVFDVQGFGLFLLNPSALYVTFPVTFLSILFAVQVVRFRMGKAPRRQTLLLGAASILPAAAWGFMGYTAVVQSGLLIYVGPVPIQLIVGLLFMKYSANWQIDKTFDGEAAKNWWEKEASN
jgi:hypothetical protein